VLVPCYEQQRPADWRYIISDSGAKVVIAARQTIHSTVSPWTKDIDTLEHVLCYDDAFDPSSSDSWVKGCRGNVHW